MDAAINDGTAAACVSQKRQITESAVAPEGTRYMLLYVANGL